MPTANLKELITHDWVKLQIRRYKIPIKVIAIDTCVERTSISSYISGKRNMSAAVKAMFYYYFKSL